MEGPAKRRDNGDSDDEEKELSPRSRYLDTSRALEAALQSTEVAYENVWELIGDEDQGEAEEAAKELSEIRPRLPREVRDFFARRNIEDRVDQQTNNWILLQPRDIQVDASGRAWFHFLRENQGLSSYFVVWQVPEGDAEPQADPPVMASQSSTRWDFFTPEEQKEVAAEMDEDEDDDDEKHEGNGKPDASPAKRPNYYREFLTSNHFSSFFKELCQNPEREEWWFGLADWCE